MGAPSARCLKSNDMSRTNEIAVDPGVTPLALGNISTRTANAVATPVWSTSFCHDRRPRLRALLILMKSSRKPTNPSPIMRKSTSRALGDIGRHVTRCANP